MSNALGGMVGTALLYPIYAVMECCERLGDLHDAIMRRIREGRR